MSAKQNLQGHRKFIWWGIFGFTILSIVYTFYTITVANFAFTYTTPPTPLGTLYSERWSRDFFFTGSLVLLFLVPVTAAFMSHSPCERDRQICHVVILGAFFLYFLVVFGFWSYDYSIANQGSCISHPPMHILNKCFKATATNAHNSANDPRWCCVNFNLAGSGCANTAICPGISAADLVVSGTFLFKFWFLFVILLMLMGNFVYVMGWFIPAVSENSFLCVCMYFLI